MTQAATEDSDAEAIDPRALERGIVEYQRLHRLWRAGPSDELREELRRAVGALWPQLVGALRPVARQWALSHQLTLRTADSWSDAVEEATTSLCIEILDRLPRLELRPGSDPAPLLRTIARRREIDGYRRVTQPGEARPAPADEPAPAAATAASRRRYQSVALDDALLQSCADQLSQEFESGLIEREYTRQVGDTIAAFWRAHLSSQELLIIRERLLREVPTAHSEIVRLLGAPWNEEMVRARLSRINRRTREHLQARGLLAE